MFQLTVLSTSTAAPAKKSQTVLYLALGFIIATLTIFSFVVYYRLFTARKAARVAIEVNVTKSSSTFYASTSTLVDMEKGISSPVMIKMPEPAASTGQSRIRSSLDINQATMNDNQVNSGNAYRHLGLGPPPRVARPLSPSQTAQTQPSNASFETTSFTASSPKRLTPPNIPLPNVPVSSSSAPLKRHSTTSGLKPLLLVEKVNRRSLDLRSTPRVTRDYSGELSQQLVALQHQMEASLSQEDQSPSENEPAYRTEYTDIPIRASFARRRLQLGKQKKSATPRIDLPKLSVDTRELKLTLSAPGKRGRSSTIVAPMTPPPTPAFSGLDPSPTLPAHMNTNKGKGREEPVIFDEHLPLSPPLTPVFGAKATFKESPVWFYCPELLPTASPGASTSSIMSPYPTIEAGAMLKRGRAADFAKDLRGAGHSDDEVVKDVVARHSQSSEHDTSDKEEDPLYWENLYEIASPGSSSDEQRHYHIETSPSGLTHTLYSTPEHYLEY